MKKTKRKPKRLGSLAIILIEILVVLGIYFFGYIRSTTVFWPGTTINGVKVGGKTAKAAEKAINRTAPTMDVIMKNAETGETMIERLQLINADYYAVYDTKALLKYQNTPLWFKDFLSAESYSLPQEGFTFDEKKLEELIDELYCMQDENQVAPVDAHLAGNGTDQVYLVPANDGCQIRKEEAKAMILSAARAGESSVDVTSCYETAQLREDEPIFQTRLKLVESVYRKAFTIRIYDDVTETVSEEELRKMVHIGEDASYQIDEAAVKAYTKALAEKYPNVEHRRGFLTTKGHLVPVGDNQDVYLYTFDTDEMVKSLSEHLPLIGDLEMPACWYRMKKVETQQGGKTVETEVKIPGLTVDEFGVGTEYDGTYIEISIDDQHLWYYEHGELMLDTDVVTGRKGYSDSPCCAEPIWYRADGYIELDHQSFVDYWMAFYGVSYGIHDAARWRDEYGGDIYLRNGSGGCINTPYEMVEKLYEMTDYGTMVIVYEESTNRGGV
ncbi:MAG: L,D-transpeptidase family protein [Firmicutes bacterium]|nr:L,D-transpeptidase family protein [Bacillota bacterium]